MRAQWTRARSRSIRVSPPRNPAPRIRRASSNLSISRLDGGRDERGAVRQTTCCYDARSQVCRSSGRIRRRGRARPGVTPGGGPLLSRGGCSPAPSSDRSAPEHAPARYLAGGCRCHLGIGTKPVRHSSAVRLRGHPIRRYAPAPYRVEYYRFPNAHGSNRVMLPPLPTSRLTLTTEIPGDGGVPGANGCPRTIRVRPPERHIRKPVASHFPARSDRTASDRVF